MDPHELQVELAERSYSILVGPKTTSQIAERLANLFPKSRHAFVIFDANVQSLASLVECDLAASNWRITSMQIPSGEASKSVAEVENIWRQMLHAKTDRGSVVVAVGGGVVGDLAGFAAATFARGLSLVQVPTTLLSQVDSSVGGKTGINLPEAKNIVGAFWQPALVVIDTQSLNSLPTREYISGLAEIVKYGVILLPELFDYLESHAAEVLQRDPAAIQHLIIESCRAKASVVQQDERETTGLRAVLNYGHTFGHAIETIAGYGKWLHGEAVAIGMNMAAQLAMQLGRVDQNFVKRQFDLLTQFGLPTQLTQADPQQLWQAMQSDKKVEHGTLRFVLPTRIGHVELVSGILPEQVQRAIQACTHQIV
jgi:3-dehydroquinate synthase